MWSRRGWNYDDEARDDRDPEELSSPELSADDDDAALDMVQVDPEPIDEDTYGMTLCALVRDFHFIAKGDGTCPIRILRLFVTFTLMALTLTLQIMLMIEIKTYVTSKSVKEIRESYDKYELQIYGEGNTTLTSHGNHRGIPEKWPGLEVARARLLGLNERDIMDICRIPLSQPIFFFLVLFIWTATVLNDVRRNTFMFRSIVIGTENADDMSEALDEDPSLEGKERVVSRLTCGMKLIITAFVFIPRWIIATVLWWLGCRWLLATNSFQDLILNAIALEFVLLLKDGIYVALMPHRNKVDLANTKIRPWPENMVTSNTDIWGYCLLSLTFMYLILACGAVIGYMLWWQMVLPEYQWDVHETCQDFISKAFHVGL